MNEFPTPFHVKVNVAPPHVLRFAAGVNWGVTVVVTVKNQSQSDSRWTFSVQAVVSQVVFTSGGCRVELSRVARLPLARTVIMVGKMAGMWVPTSS